MKKTVKMAGLSLAMLLCSVSAYGMRQAFSAGKRKISRLGTARSYSRPPVSHPQLTEQPASLQSSFTQGIAGYLPRAMQTIVGYLPASRIYRAGKEAESRAEHPYSPWRRIRKPIDIIVVEPQGDALKLYGSQMIKGEEELSRYISAGEQARTEDVFQEARKNIEEQEEEQRQRKFEESMGKSMVLGGFKGGLRLPGVREWVKDISDEQQMRTRQISSPQSILPIPQPTPQVRPTLPWWKFW